MHRMAAVLALAAAAALPAATARAVDPFEIQVYDGTLDAPGAAGVELHANAVVAPDLEPAPPEVPPHRQTHLTVEPSFGITRFWEAGAYLQTALHGDGSYHYAGAKLRSKLIRPRAPRDVFRLGLNVELSWIPEAYDAARWGAEVRPILAWSVAGGRVFLAVNPILDVALDRAEAPAFEPALTALYVIEGLLSFGVESYASFGPVDGWRPVSQQEHYLYEVVNVLAWSHVEVNVGIGEGLTHASKALVPKVILGFRQ